MCGRFADADEADIVDTFGVQMVRGHREPSDNVSPTDLVRVIMEDAAQSRLNGQLVRRELRLARWGLVPSWAKVLGQRSPLINARAETLTVKPSFRAAASQRRAIVPAAGYYEWAAGPGGKKRQFFLRQEDTPVLGFAGVYEWWRVPAGVVLPGSEDGWLCSTVIVTRPALDSIGQIHDRMPVVVPPELADAWLDPSLTSLNEVDELLAAIPDPLLVPSQLSPAEPQYGDSLFDQP